jgi:tetratricopeptide (TPR) repeat protein
MLDKFLAMNPNDPDLNMDAAELAQFYGESDKALALLAKVMLLRPGRKELVLRMADWREWAGQYKEAEASLEDALKLMPEPNERQPDTYANRRDVQIRLMDHYTYQGDPGGMYRTVQRLIP